MIENPSDLYYTIAQPSSETIFKEKKSKFYGYAFPVQDEDEIKPIIEELKSKYKSANHVCYTWRLGVLNTRFRANDDGEPSNSAGMPIYGQIQAFEATNILVAVAREFGGTKLGVGGLISAYRISAQMALEACAIVPRVLKELLMLSFNYPEMEKVMRLIKQQNLEVISQEMELTCSLTLSIRKNDFERIVGLFDRIYNLKVQISTIS